LYDRPAAGAAEKIGSVPTTLPRAVTADAGSTITVPIVTGDATGKGVIAYDFTLDYDPEVLTPDITSTWNSRTISGEWSVVVNTEKAGQLRVTAFSTSELSGSGVLLNLSFKAVGSGDMETELKWPVFQLHEGEIPAGLSTPRASNRYWFLPRR
jgi:hypothetical protein